MKKSLWRLTVGFVLVLSGCSVHFHGEAGAKSSETSGDEDASKDKPKDKDKKDRDKDNKDDRDKKDDDKKDDDKKDDDKKDDDKKDDKKDDDKKDDKKDDDKKDDDKKDDDKKDDDKKDDDKKDDKKDTTKKDDDKKDDDKKDDDKKDDGKKPTPSKPVIDVVGAGTNTIRIKPDKGVAQGSRGEPVNPPDDAEGSKPNADGAGSKPDKGTSKGSPAGGGFAIQPGRTVPGLGTINKPVAVTGFECTLGSKKVKPGAALTIKGRGFDDSTEVLISGVSIDVRSRTATKLVAKLPKELENGGDVTLKQGNLVASCGKLEISKEGAR